MGGNGNAEGDVRMDVCFEGPSSEQFFDRDTIFLLEFQIVKGMLRNVYRGAQWLVAEVCDHQDYVLAIRAHEGILLVRIE